MQGRIWMITVSAALMFILAEVADWRRRNRADVDKVGFMPWRGISLLSAAAAFLSVAFWLHSGASL